MSKNDIKSQYLTPNIYIEAGKSFSTVEFMNLVKGITTLFIVLLMLGYLLPPATAESDSLKVIIIAEDITYEPDDTIQIEVHVFDKGVLSDADDVNVTLDTNWQGTDIAITMSRVQTGVYQGSYQIQSDDHHAWFSTRAVKGDNSDEEDLFIDIVDDQLELDIHFDHQSKAYAWPGDSLTATLKTRYRGDLVDVDDFTYIRLIDPSDDITDLTNTWISEGSYQITFTIPNATENGDYELEVRATYANAHANANALITVNVMTVWYNLNSIGGSTATFTLGVADEMGKGVADATITITQPQHLTGTTGEDGTAIFSLTGIWNGVHVAGSVTSSGMEQSFNGNIYITDYSEILDPTHRNFDVIYVGSEYIYNAGSSVVRSYKAYNSTVPLQNKEIYYYITLEGMDIGIYDGHLLPDNNDRHIDGSVQVVDSGIVTTNQLGDFSVSFKAPSAQGLVNIHFEAGIPRHPYNYDPPERSGYDPDDELVYEEDFDSDMFISKGDLWNADSVTIESDPLIVGGKTKVTIKTSQALDDGDELFAKWMPGIPKTGLYIDDFESDWVCWVDGGNSIFLTKNHNDKEYTGYTVIPDFMSNDGNYTIVAGPIDGTTGYPNINHVSLKKGESAGEKGLDLSLLLALIAVFVVIIIIIALVAFTRDKGVSPNPKRFPPPPPPPEINEQVPEPEDTGEGSAENMGEHPGVNAEEPPGENGGEHPWEHPSVNAGEHPGEHPDVNADDHSVEDAKEGNE